MFAHGYASLTSADNQRVDFFYCHPRLRLHVKNSVAFYLYIKLIILFYIHYLLFGETSFRFLRMGSMIKTEIYKNIISITIA
jgi:hypothetical protein